MVNHDDEPNAFYTSEAEWPFVRCPSHEPRYKPSACSWWALLPSLPSPCWLTRNPHPTAAVARGAYHVLASRAVQKGEVRRCQALRPALACTHAEEGARASPLCTRSPRLPALPPPAQELTFHYHSNNLHRPDGAITGYGERELSRRSGARLSKRLTCRPCTYTCRLRPGLGHAAALLL